MSAWHWQGWAQIALDVAGVVISMTHDNLGVGFATFFAFMAGLTAGVMLGRG